MNNPTSAQVAKEARQLQRDGMTADAAAAYMGMTVEELDHIGGVMVVAEDTCSRCRQPFHKCECFRVDASAITLVGHRGDF